MGFIPRDFYDPDNQSLEAHDSSLEASPDPFETALRLRHTAKENILKSIVEERIAKANRTRVQQYGPEQDYKPGAQVDIYRTPDRKDQSGWRGPAELVKIKSEMCNGMGGCPPLVE